MDMQELQAKVTDKRIMITMEDGLYHADVVDEEGGENRLGESEKIDGLYEQLRKKGVAK